MSSFGAVFAAVMAEAVLGALQSMWGMCPTLRATAAAEVLPLQREKGFITLS